MEQPSKLLKVMSVIFEIFGIIMLVTGTVNTIGRSFALAFDRMEGWYTTDTLMLISVSIISIACGLLYLICGVWGNKAKRLKETFIMSFVILAVQIVCVIITIVIFINFRTFDSLPQHLTGIALAVIFIIGVRQAKARAVLEAPAAAEKPE